MDKVRDIIVIGAGPAGVSAALTAKSRDKDVLVLSGPPGSSGLYKAERIDNYPGLPEVSGAELYESINKHAASRGIPFETERVISAAPSGDMFFVSAGSSFLQCRALIICVGVTQKSAYPGERELLGQGVSYCATCDGMLFKGKRVAVLGLAQDAAEEANFLHSIGCEVKYFAKKEPVSGLNEGIEVICAERFEITGTNRVEALVADGVEHPCDGVFILRSSVAVDVLLPGIKTREGHIEVNRQMETSIPGIFAGGDCTGAPYQIAKAAGEGNLAALSAVKYMDKS